MVDLTKQGLELPPTLPFLESLQEKLVLAEAIGFPAEQLKDTYAVVSKFKENIKEVTFLINSYSVRHGIIRVILVLL